MKFASSWVPSVLFLGAITIPGLASGQGRDMSHVQIRPHQVADGIYYLEGQGGNIGLSVGEDGVVMIDDQFAPLTDRIVAAIRQINDGEIRFVINTHVHPDHTGGNENLGRMGVLILARDAVRVRLAANANTAPAALPAAPGLPAPAAETPFFGGRPQNSATAATSKVRPSWMT